MRDKETELIWECKTCDVKLVTIDGKRKFEIKDGMIKPFTESWSNYLMLTRNCKHENKVWNEAYCKRCGRKLKNHKSVERSIGPVCWCKDEQARKEMVLEEVVK